SHGRIYRLVYDGATPKPFPDLGPEKPENCLAALSNDNLFWRLHAQRLLVESRYTEAKDHLIGLLKDRSLDAVNLNPPAIHALWTLHGLGLVNENEGEVMMAVYESLSHPSAGVRKNAVRVLPATGESLMKIKEAGLLVDRN